jgi:MYXO-CTERM domain-containing protein
MAGTCTPASMNGPDLGGVGSPPDLASGGTGGKGGCSCDVGHDAPAPSPMLLAFGALLLFRVRRRARGKL